MKWYQSVRYRLLMIIVTLLLSTLLVVSGTSFYFAQQYLEDSIDDTENSVADNFSFRIKTDMDILIVQLEDLASIARLQSGDKTQILPAISEAHKRIGKFESIVFASLDGLSINEAGAAINIVDRDYFKRVMEIKKPYVSNVLVSRVSNKSAVVLSVPVMRGGQLIGVLGGVYPLDSMATIVKSIKYRTKGYGFIVDDSGVYLAHPTRPEQVGHMNMKTGEMSAELQKKLGSNVKLDPRLIEKFKETSDKGVRTHVKYKSTAGIDQAGSLSPIELPGGQRWVLVLSTTLEDATSESTALTRMILGLSVICILLALAVTFWVSGSFIRPIIRVAAVVQEIAQGNLKEITKTITDKSEFGQLSDNVILMNQNLRELVRQIQSQAQQVAAASEELTASADESANAANHVAESSVNVTDQVQKQLRSVGDAAAVVSEISASIEEVSATVQSIVVSSDSTASLAQSGGKDVNNAVKEIRNIEVASNRTGELVGKLGERSKEIGQFVATISGIAAQTNLLALNAAIEAARAGEQGRGFAVVAEEVRKLAEQSAEAAKQIASLITEIQKDTDDAVKGVNEASLLVRHGTEVVSNAGETFNQIVEKVLEVSEQIRQTAQAVDQVAIGSQRIVNSVEEIDGAAKKTAGQAENISAAAEEQSAGMEEIASSSRALAQLAQEMNLAISKFRI